VGDPSIVVGKYLGALGYLGTLLGATLVHVVALEAIADPDYGPIFTGYAGLLLTGALYVAVGLVFSAMSSSQVVAFLLTVSFFFALHVASTQGAASAPEPWSGLLYELSIQMRLRDFSQGVFETRHAVFFVATSAFAVVLASLLVESRRWR
jgi:ABC-2 type transport system permease protein